jgi:hypothetical protein
MEEKPENNISLKIELKKKKNQFKKVSFLYVALQHKTKLMKTFQPPNNKNKKKIKSIKTTIK